MTFSDVFVLQLVLAVGTFVVNLYCLGAMAIVPKLRSWEFAFVQLQNVVDLFATGILNSIYALFQLEYQLLHYCNYVEGIKEEQKLVLPEGRCVKQTA